MKRMFQTGSYSGPPTSVSNSNNYANIYNDNLNDIMMRRSGSQQGIGVNPTQVLNPNIPSSSRANVMTSTATAGYMQMNHMHAMGPPSMINHPGYAHMAQMQQQQQINGSMSSQMQSHNPMAVPTAQQQWQNIYGQQGPPHPQGMYGSQNGYNQGQRPGNGFMQPHGMSASQQTPSSVTPTKKTTKRKSNQQKQQDAMAAIVENTSGATAPPPKQAFINPMGAPGSFNGNFVNGTGSLNNHLSPYHQHAPTQVQHQPQLNQMQAYNDWTKQQQTIAASNGTRGTSRNEPPIRGDVRSKLHASIHSRQNPSPQQLAAMMSPNEVVPARYLPGTTAGKSISSSTMMSPPRVNHVPTNSGHAVTPYSVHSNLNSSSIATEQCKSTGQQGRYGFSPNKLPPINNYYPHSSQTNGVYMNGTSHCSIPGIPNVSKPKELPQVTLEDCNAVLQETDFTDFNSISFDMSNKQGFEFNYDESRTLVQRILS